MKLYAVGAPESFYVLSSNWLLKTIIFGAEIKPRVFTQAELETNLNSLPEIRLFISQDEASNYARTLRITRASHIPDPTRKKIAPVIHLDIPENLAGKYLQTEVNAETVNYTVYAGAHVNFASKDNNGGELTNKSQINYRKIAAKDFHMSDFTVNYVELPDSGNPIQNFNANVVNAKTTGTKLLKSAK